MITRWERIQRQHGKRKSNYKSFDKAIDLHFRWDTPTNKQTLSDKMSGYGFHVVNNEKDRPTDKQLNHAWEYILKHFLPKQKDITDYYTLEIAGISHITRKSYYRYRATRNIIYKNKKYRKGQFMPKQEMLNVD